MDEISLTDRRRGIEKMRSSIEGEGLQGASQWRVKLLRKEEVEGFAHGVTAGGSYCIYTH